LNACLKALLIEVYDAKRKLLEERILVTAETIKNVLIGKEKEWRMILKVFAEHNTQMKELVGKI
jgi:hypothetical protein